MVLYGRDLYEPEFMVRGELKLIGWHNLRTLLSFEAADASRRYDTDPIVSLQFSTRARRGTGDRDLA